MSSNSKWSFPDIVFGQKQMKGKQGQPEEEVGGSDQLAVGEAQAGQ